MRPKVLLISIIGFILSTVLFMALSVFTIMSPFIYSHLSSSISYNAFSYLFTILYFSGMPAGKVLGRIFGFHKRPSFFTFLMIVIIAITIPLIYYGNNLILVLVSRFIEGTSTFLMEIYSIEFSSFLALRERIIPSSISIGGIPTGVALGGLIVSKLSSNVIIIWTIFSMVLGAIFSLSIYLARNSAEMKKGGIKRKTGFKNPLTWYMGIIWMSIAGFNLSLAIILPLYLEMINPSLIGYSLGIFGYAGAIFTFIGGILAFLLYTETKRNISMIYLAVFSYAISFIGFISLIIFGIKNIGIDIVLISFEAMNVAIIYSIPKDIFGETNFANSTWEFSLIGSSGHILAPLILIPIALNFGFVPVFSLYAAFPVISSLLFIRIKNIMSKAEVNHGIIEGHN